MLVPPSESTLNEARDVTRTWQLFIATVAEGYVTMSSEAHNHLLLECAYMTVYDNNTNCTCKY